mgnify:CR=1 FL=1
MFCSVGGRVASKGETVPPSVRVPTTPCSAGYLPVKKVLRLGEHMAAAQKAFSKVRPWSTRRCRLGRLRAAQPVGQCMGLRSWSVMNSTMLGRRSIDPDRGWPGAAAVVPVPPTAPPSAMAPAPAAIDRKPRRVTGRPGCSLAGTLRGRFAMGTSLPVVANTPLFRAKSATGEAWWSYAQTDRAGGRRVTRRRVGRL